MRFERSTLALVASHAAVIVVALFLDMDFGGAAWLYAYEGAVIGLAAFFLLWRVPGTGGDLAGIFLLPLSGYLIVNLVFLLNVATTPRLDLAIVVSVVLLSLPHLRSLKAHLRRNDVGFSHLGRFSLVLFLRMIVFLIPIAVVAFIGISGTSVRGLDLALFLAGAAALDVLLELAARRASRVSGAIEYEPRSK